MRTIEQTGQFKRDYKREAKGQHRQMLASDFMAIITALANDQSLAEKHRDPFRIDGVRWSEGYSSFSSGSV
jgi:mRNA interferase YafQ